MKSLALLFGAAALLAFEPLAQASLITYTSSASFNTATTGEPLTVEQYATGTNGQTIATGGAFNGLTYSFAAGPFGTLLGGIITNQFSSFSGLSLGGQQSGGQQYFFGGDSVTITFPNPIDAVGVFFNVNANSGNYDLDTLLGDATTGSAAYDTSTYVFDGITSTTPFTSITLVSANASGSYNIPEIEFAIVPEPASLAIFGAGLAMLGVMRRKRKSS